MNEAKKHNFNLRNFSNKQKDEENSTPKVHI